VTSMSVADRPLGQELRLLVDACVGVGTAITVAGRNFPEKLARTISRRLLTSPRSLRQEKRTFAPPLTPRADRCHCLLHCPKNKEMRIAYSTMLFVRSITDGRSMMCSVLTLSIGINQRMVASSLARSSSRSRVCSQSLFGKVCEALWQAGDLTRTISPRTTGLSAR
jgi:hypothetical protein